MKTNQISLSKKIGNMENQMCFECLKRRIEKDFTENLTFCYGLSHSALPFGSSAVVQLPKRNGDVHSSSSSSQFVVTYLTVRNDGHDCLADYIDEHTEEYVDRRQSGEDENVTISEVGPAQSTAGMAIHNQQCVSSNSSQERSNCCSSNGRNSSLWGFGSKNCSYSLSYSCLRAITALAPVALVGSCSYSLFEETALNFFNGSLEDHILCSISLLIEGKASERNSVNLLKLMGVPSFDENGFPGCLRHPNIAPVLGMLKTAGHINIIFSKPKYNLENILHYSPDALKTDWHIRFLVYQILSALVYMHSLGIAHGNICPSNVMLSDLCWSWLQFFDKPSEPCNLDIRHKDPASFTSPPLNFNCCMEGCYSQSIYGDMKLSQGINWHSEFMRWWRGKLSNFEYLLILNSLAGRRWGDHTFHMVMPWVTDFSTKPEENSDTGWRDLSKSKWRLAKGDEQLDFTYSTSEVPHHVSDECLSELAVCSYKARRLPLNVLRTAVRSVYEPNEYPSTMQRLYQWTPDECIPEFYCDPQIFNSLHSGMADLAVPSWASSPEEFIKLHRDALESDRVSRQIHHWIDIIFGYKMSGEAAVAAKNVMLPSSEPTRPRSTGRRQLFYQPHPKRLCEKKKIIDTIEKPSMHQKVISTTNSRQPLQLGSAYLGELEKASTFSDHASHLTPVYHYHSKISSDVTFSAEEQTKGSSKECICGAINYSREKRLPCNVNTDYLLDHIEVEDDGSLGYQDLLQWKQQSSLLPAVSKDVANDIFSVGCVLGELHLRRPLFDATSLTAYTETGVLPKTIQRLPPHLRIIVEACIQRDWMRRPSAKSLLESPYFPATVKSAYLFVSPLQLLAKDISRLRYAANFAKRGALKAMGTFAAEMCAPYCLPLVVNPLSDIEAEWAYVLLKEFIKCMTPKAIKSLVMPAVQKILQTAGYSHLKVSLLQDSFVREIWNQIGKQAYLETLHPLVISNLYNAPHKSSTTAAAVLLIGSSEELGVPITIHQTILPLIHCFGKGLCADGIDVLVRIGGLLGETFTIRQMLPLLKNFAYSCINISSTIKPEPVQSWNSLALIDCLTTLDGILAFLPNEVVIKELIEDRGCLYVMVLMQSNLEISVYQVAATMLMETCQRIGADLTAIHVLPKLKDLFDQLAFSQDIFSNVGSSGNKLKISKTNRDGEPQFETRVDLVMLLYPSFAALLGIEKLRQCCPAWLLLEQFLLRCHNWKWEYTGESSRSIASRIARKPLFKGSTSEHSPAKLLLNGVGWSVPQYQGNKSTKNLMTQRRNSDVYQNAMETSVTTSSHIMREPWFWLPSPSTSWDGPDFLARAGGPKDDVPWKIRSSILYSVRAHQGALRSLAVCPDECTMFSAGTGSGFRGTVQKWDLTRINSVSGYYGHEEVVNDICLMSSGTRIASCDGTIHVWHSHTGKLISVYAEPSVDIAHHGNPLSTLPKINAENAGMLNSNPTASGIMTGPFDGSLYTCMHQLKFVNLLVVGTGNGSLRFIDVSQDRKLHLWRGDAVESGFHSLVSAICSSGSNMTRSGGISEPASWIAAGLSSGHCRLFDARSGSVITQWRAHDGYVTKLAAPEAHMLVSSSLDRTLRIWDLRRNSPSQAAVFKGHTDGISSFSLWGQDVISISKSMIGLSSLSNYADEDGQHRVRPHKLYMADNGSRNLSVLSSIAILPFSRLFVVGTEDGYLKVCC